MQNAVAAAAVEAVARSRNPQQSEHKAKPAACGPLLGTAATAAAPYPQRNLLLVVVVGRSSSRSNSRKNNEQTGVDVCLHLSINTKTLCNRHSSSSRCNRQIERGLW